MLKHIIVAMACVMALAGNGFAKAKPVSINDLNVEDLMELEGGVISQGLAQRIVDYRNAHGPFRSEADLLLVPDLNPALLDVLMLEEKDGDLLYTPDADVSMPTY